MKTRFLSVVCCLGLIFLASCSSSEGSTNLDDLEDHTIKPNDGEDDDSSSNTTSSTPDYNDESYPYTEVEGDELTAIINNFDENYKDEVKTLEVTLLRDRTYNSYNYNDYESSSDTTILNYTYQSDRSDKDNYYYYHSDNNSDSYMLRCKFESDYYTYYYDKDGLYSKQRLEDGYLEYYVEEEFFDPYLIFYNDNFIDYSGIRFWDEENDNPSDQKIVNTTIETKYYWNGYYLKAITNITYLCKIISRDEYYVWNEFLDEDEVFVNEYVWFDDEQTAEVQVVYNSSGYAVYVDNYTKDSGVYYTYSFDASSASPSYEFEEIERNTYYITHNASFNKLEGN